MPLQVIYFAIREIGTDKYIPFPKRWNGTKTGVKLASPAEAMPRLFLAKGPAKQAMDCWLMGDWGRDWTVDDGLGMPMPPDPTEKRENKLEVVQLKVEFPT